MGFFVSNNKTMKKSSLIKTCKNVKPQFDVLSLQQPDNTSVSCLHLSPKDSVRTASFSFEQKEHMVGLGAFLTKKETEI